MRAARAGTVLTALCAALLSRAIAPAAPEIPEAEGGGSFRFAVFGDNQPHSAFALPNKVYGQILDRIGELNADFVVSVGDIIRGSNSSTVFRRQVAEFLESSKRLQIPYHIAFGNHEMICPDNIHFLKEMVGPFYSSFNHKGAHFILLNTNLPGQDTSIAGEQYEWLKKDLQQNAGARPIFVFMHRPVFSAIPSFDDMKKEESEKLHALFLAHGVAAVFNGHQHLYYLEEHDGIRYYTTAGAGGELVLGLPNSFYHFLLVTVNDGKFRVDLQKLEGSTTDVFNGIVSMDSPLCAEPLGGYSRPAARRMALSRPDPSASTPAAILFSQGCALQEGGNAAHAVDKFNAALDADPSLAGALNNKAVILAEGGGTAEAEALLRRAVNARGAPEEARYNLALVIAGDGRGPESLKVLEEGLAGSPGNALFTAGMGFVHAEMKNFSAARAAFERALSSRMLSRQMRLELARLLIDAGEYDAAETACRQVLEGSAGDVDAMLLMGDARALAGKRREALECYERILQADPRNAEVHIRMGNLLLTGGDPKAASDEYRQALAVDRDSVPALYNYALADIKRTIQQKESSSDQTFSHETFGNLPAVLPMLKSILAQDVRSDIRAKTLNNLAVMLYLGGLAEPMAIEEYLKKAIAADERLPQPRVNLGTIYWETGRTGLAGLSYLKALELDPDCSSARYNLAMLLVLDGKVDEGIDVFRELLARDPSHCDAWNSLADVYMHRHRSAQPETLNLVLALQSWRRSLSVKPGQVRPQAFVKMILEERPELAGTPVPR